MRRLGFVVCAVLLGAALASPAMACGGLIGRNGAVNLSRTTTLAAYHGGLEHYVTAFTYAGGGGAFGSIVPLPGMPSNVERGGDWTLQRLVRETSPPVKARAEAVAVAQGASAEEVYKTRVDALDITVLKGGGRSVGEWASKHGFLLPPDTPEVLDYYARRSPFFMAAVFDDTAAAERGQQLGDGTPIHLTIPTANPWVPLRILGLGKRPAEIVDADIYLLTDRAPALLPLREEGFRIERRSEASASLLDDLRADKGMEWVPQSMWLTHIELSSDVSDLRYDLAVDASGKGAPSRLWAGLPEPPRPPTPKPTPVPTQAPAPVEPSPELIIPVAIPPAANASGGVPLALPLAGIAAAAAAFAIARAFRLPR